VNIKKSTAAVAEEVGLRIILLAPPAGVDFGIQEGKGNDYRAILKQRSTGGDLSFEFKIAVKGSREDGAPNFVGPFAQGPAAERFVYVDIGKLAGQANTPWERRLKVGLAGITAKMVKDAVADSSVLIEVSLPGTSKDGGPSCASVKPVSPWKCVKRKGGK
jgi:hypothetical protein